VPEPIVPRGISTDLDQLATRSGDGKQTSSLLHLNLGATVWDATSPLTPVLLSETERRFKFRGLPQAVGAARRSLREWERHFEPELFYDLSLCVSELVTKSVQYAQAPPADEIELAVSRDNELVRAEVMEHRKDVVVTQPPIMDSKDWGMFIVDRVADRWGVDRSLGTLLWCEIDLGEDGRSRDWLASNRRLPASSI
jgi:anti-sigma regulatory factor (Ser/Thr protein kinase)